ncbi:MAG: nitrile hydratase accessory protein [Alphaproteobacteria bacterium]|nr:nitrile hydratase accessory protein [Alphaproteobacteria bacterium]
MTTSTPPERAAAEGAAAVDMDAVPGLPRDRDGPIFAAPWQAQAFAMTVRLHEQGCFSWPEWAAFLSAEIKAAQADGDPDAGETYYNHWLAALEKIVAAKGLVAETALAERRDAWDKAAQATPHGHPIELTEERSD